MRMLLVNCILMMGPSMNLLQHVQDTLKTKIFMSELGPVLSSLVWRSSEVKREKFGALAAQNINPLL